MPAFPTRPSDPLSDALGINHGPCEISRGFAAGEYPWALRFDTRQRLPVAVRGACWLILDGQEPMRLDEGDLAVPSGAVPFVLASDLAMTPRDADEIFAADPSPILPLGGGKLGGNGVVGIARQVETDHEERLLTTLPSVTRIRAADPAADALRYPLDRVLQELVHRGPGSEFAREQYAQAVLIEVLRVALDARKVPESGWLRLYSDEMLRPALTLIHKQPAYPWRLADLAQAVAMSQSAFITRFRALSGEPPLTYLHHWRMRLARAALRDTDSTIAALSTELGYGSESAFSHAFTRTAGVSPSRYRALHRSL
jgi:AraC-like DNA-binding protein